MEKSTGFYTETSDSIEKINVQTINQIGNLALSLKPMTPCVSIKEGYLLALKKYFAENMDDTLYEVYSILTSSTQGQRFLGQTIELQILENAMRTFGIDAETTKVYSKLSKMYNELLDGNNNNYQEAIVQKSRHSF